MQRKREYDRLPSGPFVIGHRGSGVNSSVNPHKENTVASFLHAVNSGAGWVELDTKTNADGTLVIHHNVTINGTLISALTDTECRNLELTFMDDVHKALPLWVGIDFEIKFDLGDARTDDDIHACLRWAYDHGRERPLVVTSFDPATVKEATLLWLPSGWITHQGAPLYESVASAARLGCSVAVVHEDAVLAAQDTNPGTGDVRELLYDTGLRLWAWNVHTENVPILVAAGVTGLCTDEIAPLVPLVPYHS